MHPSRPLYWNIDALWLFYLCVGVTLLLFGWGLARRLLLWSRRSREGSLSLDLSRLGHMVRDGLLGVAIFRGDLLAGLNHLLIAWGFFGLFVGTTLVAIHEYLREFLFGAVYIVFSVAMEVFGLMLLAGILWAALRRILRRPSRLWRSRPLADGGPLLWLFAIGASGFALEGARLAAQSPTWAGWSFTGAALASLPLSAEHQLLTYEVLWWVHGLLSLGFIAWLPQGKLLHTIAAPLHLLRTNKMSPSPDIDETGDLPPRLQLAAAQLSSLDACTRCGRCTESCPSHGAKEPLSPREIVVSVREAPALSAAFIPSAADPSSEPLQKTLADEPLWHCTTCNACKEVCPVEVAPIELIADVRGALVEEGQALPAKLGEVLERIYKYQNPWISKKGQKATWSKGFALPDLSKKKAEADWLYFVGCTTSLDTRAQSIASSVATLFTTAGLSFGTLGKKEPCCGDIARRVGERGLFEEGRDATLKILQKRSLHRLITSSPHCFDTLSHAYPEEAELDVLHYSQMLAQLLRDGKLLFTKKLPHIVTYHDPCFLGRHAGIYDEPREVLRALPGLELIEMKQSGAKSLCCGGGGGRMWQELPNSGDLAGRRVRQAADTGAELLVTACPLCLIMLEDARKTAGLEETLEVVDLAELACRALGTPSEPDSTDQKGGKQ